MPNIAQHPLGQHSYAHPAHRAPEGSATWMPKQVQSAASNGPFNRRFNRPFNGPFNSPFNRTSELPIMHFRRTQLDRIQRRFERATRYAEGHVRTKRVEPQNGHAASSTPFPEILASDLHEPVQAAWMVPELLLSMPRSGPVVWSYRHGSAVPYSGTLRPAMEGQFDWIATHYFKPAFEMLRAIANGMLLHENLVSISNAIRAMAAGMKAPARQTLAKSSDLLGTLAELNVTLASKTRMTSVTLIILQVMRNEAASASEMRIIDDALQSVGALRRAQLQGIKIPIDPADEAVSTTLYEPHGRATTSRPNGSVTLPGSPIAGTTPALANSTTVAFNDVSGSTTMSSNAGTAALAINVSTPGRTTLRTECIRGVAWASEESVHGATPAEFASLDGVPLLWSRDAMDTWAWRLLPPHLYAEVIGVPVHSSTHFALQGRHYLQMFGCTFAVAELLPNTLWAVGAGGESLPPLPLVQAPNTSARAWAFAQPREDNAAWPALLSPSSDGFLRWQNKKYICYGEQLREVDPSAIEGEERIRTLAVTVLTQLDAPDRQGILHAPDGRRLIEGQYGYYPLLEASNHISPENNVHRITVPGHALTADVSFDAAMQRWYVLSEQKSDLWFSDALRLASGSLVTHRRRGAEWIHQLNTAQQALVDAPFLESRSDLRLALRSTFGGLVERVLRSQNSPAIWSDSEQKRLSTIWSSLTTWLATDAQWGRLTLLEQQGVLAENVALFLDLVPDFPLNGVEHQVQITALGRDALQDLQRHHVVLQMNWQFHSIGNTSSSAWDALVYMDTHALLPTLLQIMRNDDVGNTTHAADVRPEDDFADEGTTVSVSYAEKDGISVALAEVPVMPDVFASNRATFAAWLYQHRANVALIHFSTWEGLCSFENASSAAEVADMIDAFFVDTPVPKEASYTVKPRQPIRTGYV